MNMKNLITLFAVAAISMIGCGDNKGAPDAKKSDGKPADAYCSNCPAAPALGAQIDRMGRPAINTALNRGFAASSAPGLAASKDAYNQNSDPATWVASAPEFMKNLAFVDALDTGVCGNGLCEGTEGMVSCGSDCTVATGSGNGCGNQALYNGQALGGGAPMGGLMNSYRSLAAVLAADELLLDTSKTLCQLYLAVEFAYATAGMPSNSTCGGRAPTYDVIDFTLTLGSFGVRGFNPANFDPRVKDGAGPHTDLLPDFPYLGPPH